jgi:hypothetical protein
MIRSLFIYVLLCCLLGHETNERTNELVLQIKGVRILDQILPTEYKIKGPSTAQSTEPQTMTQ